MFKLAVEPTITTGAGAGAARAGRPSNADYVRQRLLKLARGGRGGGDEGDNGDGGGVGGGSGGRGGVATERTRLTVGTAAARSATPKGGLKGGLKVKGTPAAASKSKSTDDYLQRRMMQLARTPISQMPVREI